MTNDFSVEIVARGEGLVYREPDRVLHFSVTWNHKRRQRIIHAYACSDAEFQPIQLSGEDQSQIVARLTGHFESTSAQVEFLLERPPQPLRSPIDVTQHSFPKSGNR